jgi:ribosome-binding protein aMBF1 (putative translation factor)
MKKTSENRPTETVEMASADAWLNLTEADQPLGDYLDARLQESIDLRIELSRRIREAREALGWTQARVAQLMASTQPKVAKIEGAHPGVSLDTLVRAFLAVGGKIRLEGPDLDATARSAPNEVA